MAHLFDSRHLVTIDDPRTPFEASLKAAGATSILHSRAFPGALAGVYVDNETGTATTGSVQQRTQRNLIAYNLTKLTSPVVVGLYPDEPNLRIPGCITALEWYPYHLGMGMPTREALGLQPGQCGPQAWILQWNFAFKDDTPPTGLQKYRLLAWVKLHHPLAKQIWLF